MTDKNKPALTARTTTHTRPYLWAIIIFVVFTVFDQASKQWAHQALLNAEFHEKTDQFPTCGSPEEEQARGRFTYVNSTPITVVDNFFTFRYVENCSNAFSMMKNVPESFRFPFLLIISILACFGIPYMFLKTPLAHRYTLYALPFILSGAMGNLLDRMIYRYVIDFIDWYVVIDGKEHHWPTFNIADVAIVVGIGLMGIQILMTPRQKTAANKKSSK
ncbi:MAG: signal peptidase II [Deltaproteobacteria bacterium]|nr:signal peptidase II [Deltaproteobacteria bacterium]